MVYATLYFTALNVANLLVNAAIFPVTIVVIVSNMICWLLLGNIALRHYRFALRLNIKTAVLLEQITLEILIHLGFSLKFHRLFFV